MTTFEGAFAYDVTLHKECIHICSDTLFTIFVLVSYFIIFCFIFGPQMSRFW